MDGLVFFLQSVVPRRGTAKMRSSHKFVLRPLKSARSQSGLDGIYSFMFDVEYLYNFRS